MHKMLRTPRSPEEWVNFSRNLLKAHITLANMTYDDLSAALLRIGVDEHSTNLKNRVWHGRYSAVFMLQCLRAMNVDVLLLPIDEIGEPPVPAPRRRRPDLKTQPLRRGGRVAK